MRRDRSCGPALRRLRGLLREHKQIENVLGGMKLEFHPHRRMSAKVSAWVLAQARLCGARKPQVNQGIGVQMRELATIDAPGRVATETRRRLNDAGQGRQLSTKLRNGLHRPSSS